MTVVYTIAFLAVVVGVWALLSRSSAGSDGKLNPQAAAWARNHQATYRASYQDMSRCWKGPPFQLTDGQDPKVLDVIEGVTPAGREFSSFLYTYLYTTSHDLEERSSYCILTTRMPVALPDLILDDNRFVNYNAQESKHPTVQANSDVSNQAYPVTPADPQYTADLLQVLMMQWLHGPGEGLNGLRIDGRDLTIWWSSPEPDYDKLDGLLTLMEQFIERIPPLVWQQYDQAPPEQPKPVQSSG
ncbi:MAG: hypothetical protein FWF25_09855 [Propionibacteriaceae bacterium]|nr:hypothetical protein [Propionibacteriaceae bacterium]